MKKIYFVAFIIVSITLLYGCANKNSISKDVTYTSYEGMQDVGEYITYDYHGITYYFQLEEYAPLQRQSIIMQVDNTLQLLKTKKKQSFPKEFSIYFGSRLTTQGIYGKVFYQNAYEDNMENIITLLQGVYGEYANYGMLYGYADFVLQQLGIKTECIYNKEEIANYFIKQDDKIINAILDLNLPFFESVYADKQINDISKSIAILFVEDIIEYYGKEEMDTLLASSYELDSSFDIMFCNRISEWLGMELKMERNEKAESEYIPYYVKIPSPYPIRFEKNYESDCENYPYILHTESVKSYIHKDMQTLWYESEMMQWEKFDYPKMIQYFRFLETDIAIAKQYLSEWLDVEDDRVTMRFFMPNEHQNTYKSQYHSANHTASVVLLQHGYHEYIHHLTSKYAPENWLMEGLAVYMDIYYPKNKSSYVSETAWWVYHADKYEQIPDGIEKGNVEYTKALQAYANLTQSEMLKVNPKYDLEAYYERAAYMECLGYEGWGNSANYPELNMSYEKAVSLFCYMLETYGEECVFQIYTELGTSENSYMEVLEQKLGISYTELLENWKNDLIVRCETIKNIQE